MPEPRSLHGVDVRGFDATDPAILAQGTPHAQFAQMRRNSPVVWVPQVRGSAGYDDEGYWAVTRHADVMAVSRDTDTFSSWQNTAVVRFRADIDRSDIDMQRVMMLNMDPPDHTKIRNIVSRGFTPRAIASLRDALHQRAVTIVAEAAAKGIGEFVEDIACELPLQAIAELIGVPQEERKQIFEWSNAMIGYDEPGATHDDPLTAVMEVLAYAVRLGEARQAAPRDDIVTKLVNASIDGNALTADEFGFFVVLLSVAGNETTRNAMTHGMLAFFDHPEQWELFKAERPKTFVDEVIRWATPVNVFQRTATRDVDFRGAPIRRGDRVCIFYGSANYDEDVFEDAHSFNILRSPNPHLGFGGSGAHYCLGANLARLEIELMFNAIADTIPDIRPTGPVQRLFSGWVHGIKALPVDFGPVATPPTGGRSEEEIAAGLVKDVMAQFHRTHAAPAPALAPAPAAGPALAPAQRVDEPAPAAPAAALAGPVAAVKKTPAKKTPAKKAPAKKAAPPAADGAATASAVVAAKPPAKAAGAKTTGAKTTGAKASGAKTTGAKASGAKTTGAKASGAKTSGAKTSGAKASGAKTSGKAPDSR